MIRQYISYAFFRLLIAIFWLLPFPILYKLSDALAWVLCRLIKYRIHVVEQNLNLAFPNQSQAFLEETKRASYRNLSDIMLESFKAFSMSPSAIKKRYEIQKPDWIDELYKERKNIVLFASHYGNWEWATYTFPLFYDHKIIGMIKPVKNKFINRYTNAKRCSTGTQVIDIYKRSRSVLTNTSDPFILVYIADQNPSDDHNSIQINFFGTPTYCLHGMSKIAIKNDWPVVYIHTQRTARGHYKLHPILISDKPSLATQIELTQACFSELESVLKNKPEDWLRTHKRWKRNIRYKKN